MAYRLDDLKPADRWELDHWSDEQLAAIVRQLNERIERCFVVCMSNHYASGAYIDAAARWDHDYSPALERIRRYVYGNRIWTLYEQLFGEGG